MFRLEPPKNYSIELTWLHHWMSSDGEKNLSYGRQNLYHWLQVAGLADFRISADTKKISCYPLSEVSEETSRHLLLDQVLPRCLAHQGRVMLHASAVRLQQGLILFVGDSGVGKSTLAGNFHQAGSPALSDDCVWVEESDDRIVAVPSYGGLRLWGDSLEALFTLGQETHLMAHYTTKKRVTLHENELRLPVNGFPVLAMIVISAPDRSLAPGIILEPLPQRETFVAMLKQTFQLDLTDLERMTRHLQTIGRIVPRIPAYRLSMPHDFTLLSLVRQRILEAVL